MERSLTLTALALVLFALPAAALAGTPGERHDASERRGGSGHGRDGDGYDDRGHDDRGRDHDDHGRGHDGYDHDGGAGEPRDANGRHVAHPGSGPHRPVTPPPPPYRHHRRAWRPVPPPPVVVVHEPAPAPRPAFVISRAGDVSLGLSLGSLVSGYQAGPAWGDGGMGLEARYRVTDGFGLALGVGSYGSGTGERITTPLEVSAQFFGFPNGPVNPYAELGLAVTARNWEDTLCGSGCPTYTADDTSLGGHAGLGLEIALGRHAALDLEVGLLGINAAAGAEDRAFSTAFQSGIGLQWYF